MVQPLMILLTLTKLFLWLGFAAIGNEAKLNLYRKSHSTDVTFDNDDKESSEELEPPKRPSRSKI